MSDLPVTAGAVTTLAGVVETPLERLRAWADNPRRITLERLEELKQALVADREMLAARPLLALPDGTVIAGNQRLRAAQELGRTTIPVLFVDLDPERARLWALRDNNAWGEWDEPVLAELLAELSAGGVDLALSGFASSDLDRILAALQPPKDPDDAPPLPLGEPESRLGEIYELGTHRLLCADATDPDAIAAVTNTTMAAVLWTDAPYGIDYVGKTPAALTIANDGAEGIPELLHAAFAAADAALEASARFYVCSPAGPLGIEFRIAVREAGWRLHQTLAWVKHSPVLGHSDYHYQHEDVFYGWTGGPGAAATAARVGTATTAK
jgi:hypothetical protein